MQPGRNDPCPCGSGRKYKRCHGQAATAPPPVSPQTLVDLGATLAHEERFDDAERAIRSALALDDRYPAAHVSLGVLLVRRRDPEALACFERALAIAPAFLDGHIHRAKLLLEQGLIAEAVLSWRRVITLAPATISAWSSLAMSLLYADDVAPDEVLLWHRRVDKARSLVVQREASPPASRPPRAAASRLRVGLLSSDLRRHPVGDFCARLLEHHDRSRIELVCYHDNTVDDDVSTGFAAQAARWVRAAYWDDEQLARQIAGDDLDVLVDLAGHTGLRLDVLARRPAPVQATWLGYPTTTGLAAIDFRLTDARADPPAHDAQHTERLVRLPHSYFCYRPQEGAPLPGPLPALARGGDVTFGSFNNVTKISGSTLTRWAAVLQAVPRSRLLLKGAALAWAAVRERLLAELGARGIDAGRITLREWHPHAHYLEPYHEVDIALDTGPYNGATTTCEALWMGVPVVTLAGDRPQARMGASILGAAGCDAWIAEDDAGFVAIAAGLARDLERLQAARAGLRPQLSASPLLDGPGFARDFERALRTMVEQPSTAAAGR